MNHSSPNLVVGSQSATLDKVYLKVCDDRILVDYQNDALDSQLMSYNAALTLLETSEIDALSIDNPNTQEHLDHIQRIFTVWKEKSMIILNDAVEPALVGGHVKLIIDRIISSPMDEVQFSYEQMDGSDFMGIESKSIGLDCLMTCNGEKLFYDHLVENIKFLRNRDVLLSIQLQSVEPGFEKLFADLGWTFDERMRNWINQARDQLIMMTFEDDNNEYCLKNFYEPCQEGEILHADTSDSDYFSDN